MEADYWHNKWATGDIGFHEAEANALLREHFGALAVPHGGRVLVPLCGMTRDIPWLLDQGYRVVGAELSRVAVDALFEALGVQPQVTPAGPLTHLAATGIDIWVGDVFALDAARLGAVDAIYDRAALVALPPQRRAEYAAHVTTISGTAPQLLITFDYDQTRMPGPPFSIPTPELQANYTPAYRLTRVASRAVPGGLKGQVAATEIVWRLQPAGDTAD